MMTMLISTSFVHSKPYHETRAELHYRIDLWRRAVEPGEPEPEPAMANNRESYYPNEYPVTYASDRLDYDPRLPPQNSTMEGIPGGYPSERIAAPQPRSSIPNFEENAYAQPQPPPAHGPLYYSDPQGGCHDVRMGAAAPFPGYAQPPLPPQLLQKSDRGLMTQPPPGIYHDTSTIGSSGVSSGLAHSFSVPQTSNFSGDSRLVPTDMAYQQAAHDNKMDPNLPLSPGQGAQNSRTRQLIHEDQAWDSPTSPLVQSSSSQPVTPGPTSIISGCARRSTKSLRGFSAASGNDSTISLLRDERKRVVALENDLRQEQANARQERASAQQERVNTQEQWRLERANAQAREDNLRKELEETKLRMQEYQLIIARLQGANQSRTSQQRGAGAFGRTWLTQGDDMPFSAEHIASGS